MLLHAVVAPVLLLCAVACVKVNEFSYKDAASLGDDGGGDSSDAYVPPEGAVAYVEGDHIVATVPDLYKMHFSNLGYKFPYQLEVNGAQALGGGGSTCRDERGVGVNYDPLTVFSGAPALGTIGLNDIKITVAGPPVAKVQLDWSESTTACSSSQPSGRSTFTFFPDGRITRMDVVRIVGTPSAAGCECAGAASTQWKLWSYTALNPNLVSTIVPSGKPSGSNPTIPTAVPVCANGNGDAFHIAFGWYAGGSERELEYVDANAIAFKGSLANVTAGNPIGPGDVGDMISNMWIGTSDTCATLLTKIGPYNGNLAMDVITEGGPSSGIGFAQDGTYGGETSGDDDPGTATLGNLFDVTPSTSAIPAFALWLDFGPDAGNTYLVTDGSSVLPTSAYREQHVIDGNGDELHPTERIFWFPNGLAANAHIRVTAQP